MMDIFEAQIDTCISDFRSTAAAKESQKSDPPTPSPSSSRSLPASMDPPAEVSLPSSTSISAPRVSLVPEDWYATYLQSEISSDPLFPSLPPFKHMSLDDLSGAGDIQEDFSAELYYTQVDGEM